MDLASIFGDAPPPRPAAPAGDQPASAPADPPAAPAGDLATDSAAPTVADLAADLAGPCPPGVPGDQWAALLADVAGDVELHPKLHALPAEQLACWRECLARRITAGEALPGLPWRALVDVRLRFEPEAWTAGQRRAQRQPDATATAAPRPAAPEPVLDAATADPASPWLGDATTALLDKLHNAGCEPDAVPDGETFVADCPRCHRRRALAIRDTAAGVPAVRVHCPCGDAALLALDGFEPLGIGAPRRQPTRRRPRGPGCCQRCGHDRYRDVAIHGGQSIRRDCRRCGFLIGFPLWYGAPDPDLAPADGPASSAGPGVTNQVAHRALADDAPAENQHGTAADQQGEVPPELAPAAGNWPPWAAQFHARLVRADCDPRIVTARGEAGRKVLALSATCPSCRRAGALTAWPWNTGMMFARCRGDCERRAIHDALDAAAPLAESERLLP